MVKPFYPKVSMNDFHCFINKKIELFFNLLWTRLARLCHWCSDLVSASIGFLLFRVNSFWIQLSYLLVLASLGYLSLKLSNPKIGSFRPKDIDLLFMSVSAVTVSSMSTVDMEVFSNTQLIIMTLLMLGGGEVFISMLGLQFMKFKFTQKDGIGIENRVKNSDSHSSDSTVAVVVDHQIELGFETTTATDEFKSSGCVDLMRYRSIKFLGYVVLTYLVVVHVVGSILICLYISLIPSAREVVKKKGILIPTFSIFTAISTFSHCGFIPTNENMMAFKKNSGLLLLVVPQLLLGTPLYPSCLRFVIFVLERITKRVEFGYMLKNYKELEYSHLFSSLRCNLLAATVFGLLLLQFILFCSMEWNSEATDGLNCWQKVVGSLFQVINSRHAGESVFDLSTISPAILVLFVVMMYLPQSASLLPMEDKEKVSRHDKKCRIKRKNWVVEYLQFSQLYYLVIFIILICITEREKLKEDPLNFSVLNIIIEVTSAYGNVGFSTGYSCKRQIKPSGNCKEAWYGFVGRWSNKGKPILIFVMFFGRLKKFHMGLT